MDRAMREIEVERMFVEFLKNNRHVVIEDKEEKEIVEGIWLKGALDNNVDNIKMIGKDKYKFRIVSDNMEYIAYKVA